jgi:Fic/DOC family N-terminal
MVSGTRAGQYVEQMAGYKAFIPNPLPPTPEIMMDQEMWNLLSQADRALGRLDGATDALPNPDLFVFMYVRKEAVLSSQIEGTQASLIDVLEFQSQVAFLAAPSAFFMKPQRAQRSQRKSKKRFFY